MKGQEKLITGDDIDLLLNLQPHGWASCILMLNGEIHAIDISMIFGDPLEDFMHSLALIIKGQNESEFYWYGEPGGTRITIRKKQDQQHKVSVMLAEFSESFGEEIKELEESISFEIKFKQLLILAYTQLNKIKLLLEDSEYEQSRKNDFPRQAFSEFQKKYHAFFSTENK